MKKLLLIFYFFSTVAAYSQYNNKVVVKLKKDFITDTIIVANNQTGIEAIDYVSKSYGAVESKKLRSGKKSGDVLFVITFREGSDIDSAIKHYKNTGIIDYAERDYTGTAGGIQGFVPNDQYYSRQWGLKNDGSFPLYPALPGADIDMENAWTIQQGSEDIILAVMDSGLKMDHPEFEGRLWVNQNEISGNGIDDDGNGYADDVYGWDFVNNDNNPTDDQGHGTNVTGIAAANGNNGIGYSGVDSNCKIMVLKGLNNNNMGDYTWWYEAIVYAADNGADVINLSVGGGTYSAFLHDAVNYALDSGVVVVACMMNTNSVISYFPAAFNGVIAVGSTDPDDRRTAPFFWDMFSGSNYGSHISVVAPGNYIFGLSHTSNTNYDTYWGGTSQATPLVAGIATLLRAQNPLLTPVQIKQIIEDSAEDQVGNPVQDTAGFDIYYGHGRVNAFGALASTLAVTEYTAIDNDITIYPNPSDGLITVITADYPANITIYNNLGQLVLKDEITMERNTFSISAKGIYHVVIDGKKSKKIIIH